MRIPRIINGRGQWILLAAAITLGITILVPEFPESPFRVSRDSKHQKIIASTPSLPPTPDVAEDAEKSPEVPPYKSGHDPARWMTWSEIPTVTQYAREIYELGQSLGNDPRAFSIFGDCQSLPDVFLGLYTTDQRLFSSLSGDLQETVRYFKNSLNRYSPTSKDGTTSGAILWEQWHGNKYGCTGAETPMDCELRLHNPSFVLIMVGTHWEGARNEYYLRIILDTLLERGVLPILSTKADNREGDHSINLQAARLAAEYKIPLWNFWPVVENLPNRGLYTKESEPHLGDIYLTEQALVLRRLSALRVLDAIWRAVTN